MNKRRLSPQGELWFIFASVGCIFVFVVAFISMLLHCERMGPCSQAGGSDTAGIGVDGSGVLHFRAAIDAVTAAKFLQEVNRHEGSIRLVSISSGGGMKDQADRMTDILKRRLAGVPIEVPNDATCQSGCIELISAHFGPLRIGPGATLMFHSEAARVGLANCGLCGLLNDAAVSISMMVPKRSTDQRLMATWANDMSPKLVELLNLCKLDPLRTTGGMTITGADFLALQAGEISPSSLVLKCPKSR